MAILFRKNLNEITQADINELVTNQVRERQNLEYKEQMYGSSDEDIREMLRDVASMANSQGGYILIGVKEDGEGIPIEIRGIKEVNVAAERLMSSCLSNIEAG